MKRWGLMAAALLLAGCVTVPGSESAPRAELGRLLGEAVTAVRAAADMAEEGGAADFAAAKMALEQARVAAVVAGMSGPAPANPADLAGYVALGVTLGLCREGLERAELRLSADPAEGPGLATGLRLGCVAPLVLLASG